MFRFLATFLLGITTLFSGAAQNTATVVNQVTHFNQSATSTTQTTLSQDQLLALSGNPYADGNLPLGDSKYTTTTPKQGYIYLCSVPSGNGGGAQETGSWISGSLWNYLQKPHVNGSVSWPTATFTDTINGDTRTLLGNGLPVGATTGIFPIASTDPAYKYDRNPNSIKSESINLSLPVNPTYSANAYCMGMEVGVMNNGVPLFNGFDAGYRDAAAHEVQDSCDGHPQMGGEYHYHSLGSCFKDVSETMVLGFALDGFPITGPKVADGKYLTTQNLDECHGITSQINLGGKQVTMYHYVLTQDFPYSVSCFRAKPVSYQVISSQNGNPSGVRQVGQQNMMRPRPPQSAFSVCSGKTSGTSCSFTAPRATVTGTCQTPNNGQMVCVPSTPEQNRGRPINY